MVEYKENKSNYSERLGVLIDYAKQALEELREYTTTANQNALLYMVHQAESVLKGEDFWPVSGSRAFLEMDAEERLKFVCSHYVMYGFDKKKEDEFEFFGLEQALDWFVRSDIRTGEAGYLAEREWEGEEDFFLFEKEEKDYLLFSEAEWKKVKALLACNPEARRQYEQIQTIADRCSIDELQLIWNATWKDKGQLPPDTELYSDTAKGVTFRVPDGAVRARLRFQLPVQEENLQEFKIREVRLVAAGGDDGEELAVSKEGCICLGRGREIWEWEKKIPLTPNHMYTLHFQVNQRKKLKKGIQVEIIYEDAGGVETGRFCWEYNRKAWYPVLRFNLDMQCNAICYGVTGKEEYAQKAMYQLILFLDDFCQGAAYWMRYQKRPEGRDNYGAVQAGRNLAAIAMTYVFIKDAPVWEEKDRFLKLVEFVMNDAFDLRDRICLTDQRAQQGTGNWQTDMCIGAAMVAAAVEEIPYRKQWVLNAEKVLSAQLFCHLNRDGSWPESLRYHHAVLEHFCTFARFWENETGENWFYQNHLEKMFEYSIGTQMPRYAFFGNRISTPPFGDHKLGDGGEYQILGNWIAKVGETDSMLAAQMRETWERAGCPVPALYGESVVAERLQLSVSVTGRSGREEEFSTEYRTKSRGFPDAGIYLFRREKTESCLAVMCNERKIGHGHLDQGSFIYYSHGVPLIMDSGIEGYFDATTQWHISSYSHACMLFSSKQKLEEDSTEINLSAGNFSRRLGWCDTPGTAHTLQCEMGKDREGIRMEIKNSEAEGSHIRTFSFDEEGSIEIRDEVRGFEGDILFCLPMLVKQVDLEETDDVVKIYGVGYYGVDLEIESLKPVKRAWIERGRVTPMYPGEEGIPRIPYLRMVAEAKDGFLIRIRTYIS